MDEMGGACPWYRETINEYGVLIGDYLEDLGVDGRIVLK
jgi:hypothetical protein